MDPNTAQRKFRIEIDPRSKYVIDFDFSMNLASFSA
jgi:hypothetical protein